VLGAEGPQAERHVIETHGRVERGRHELSHASRTSTAASIWRAKNLIDSIIYSRWRSATSPEYLRSARSSSSAVSPRPNRGEFTSTPLTNA
jgi:hypothetical protein